MRGTSRRGGFTIVELLVAMALIVFVMVILSEAFSQSMRTFRLLKAMGDMDIRLRNVATLLRTDLAADHFDGKRRASDADFWTVGPPRQGCLRILNPTPPLPATPNPSGDPPFTVEGADGDGARSFRATDHVLHLAVRKRGNNRPDFFATQLDSASPLFQLATFFQQPLDGQYQEVTPNAPGVFTSQWGESAFFLFPNGSATSTGVRLHGLYRRVRLAVPRNAELNTSSAIPKNPQTQFAYRDLSLWDNPANPTLYFNNPTDLTQPDHRFMGGANVYAPMTDPNAQPTGSDLLLPDVVSFCVEVQLVGSTQFQPLHELQANWTNTNYAPPGLAREFDTWSSQGNYAGWATPNTPLSAPLMAPIKAVRITVRVWDFRTEQTRQTTIVQEL